MKFFFRVILVVIGLLPQLAPCNEPIALFNQKIYKAGMHLKLKPANI